MAENTELNDDELVDYDDEGEALEGVGSVAAGADVKKCAHSRARAPCMRRAAAGSLAWPQGRRPREAREPRCRAAFGRSERQSVGRRNAARVAVCRPLRRV